MKNFYIVLIIIVFMTGCAHTETPPAAEVSKNEPAVQVASDASIVPGKGVLIQKAVKVTATVISVDKADRNITVKGSEGKVRKIEMTEDVKNFDQIRPGDEVVAEVYSALAMRLAEPGKEIKDTAENIVTVAKTGEKPKVVNVDIVDVLAEISAIDVSTREVVVMGPMGRSVSIVVPEDIEKFDQLKIGDKVNARYIEAFALSVETVK